MRIPSKHPMIIPTASAQSGDELILVVSSIIFPTKVPKNAPKKSLKVFPYPAQTFASFAAGSKANTSSKQHPPKNKPALSMNPNTILPPKPATTAYQVMSPLLIN